MTPGPWEREPYDVDFHLKGAEKEFTITSFLI